MIIHCGLVVSSNSGVPSVKFSVLRLIRGAIFISAFAYPGYKSYNQCQ